jgi:exodeoxyribonuclease-5
MQLTKAQEEGLKTAIERYKNHEKYCVIAGYAGTGKSTLVNFIVQALSGLGVDVENKVGYTAFTGKACQVLQKKGCKNVKTLHKLLYDFRPKASGGFIRIPKPVIDYDVIIVDEISMAPKTLIDMLFSHPVFVICLGDSFQLPPVNKNDDNHLLDHPHIFLNEIMRQEADNDIIQLSFEIREGKPIGKYLGSDTVKIIPKDNLSLGMLQWADQVLVATNNTRLSINKTMREALGFGPDPQDGDKVICVRNYWDIEDNDGNPLINGAVGYIHNPCKSFVQYPFFLYNGGPIDITNATFITDSDMDYGNLDLDYHMLKTGEKCLDWKTAYKISKNKQFANTIPLEFLYGYAITCHKAQGSQWEKVLVMEEKFPFDKTEHARWLYTAVTRAEDKVILIK